MSFEVIATRDFIRGAKKLLKKYPSLKTELNTLQATLEENPLLGIALGDNTFKIRFAVASKGKGKSGGMRVITYVVVQNEKVYLADIYDKSEQANITDKELEELIKEIKNQA